jgi:hypothetical protein
MELGFDAVAGQLRAHELWVQSGGRRGKRAELVGCDFSGFDFSGALHHRLDLQTAVGRQHHEQRARRRGVEITALEAPKFRSRTAGGGDVVALARQAAERLQSQMPKTGIDDGSGDE